MLLRILKKPTRCQRSGNLYNEWNYVGYEDRFCMTKTLFSPNKSSFGPFLGRTENSLQLKTIRFKQ